MTYRLVGKYDYRDFNVKAFVDGFCKRLSANDVVVVMYWDNSVNYIGLDKCRSTLEEELSKANKFKSRIELAHLKNIKTLADGKGVFQVDVIARIDFSLETNTVVLLEPIDKQLFVFSKSV